MEEEVKNMIKLSYTKLNTKLKKRVAVIAAVMCAITVTSGCGSYNAEITWEIEEASSVCEEADTESEKTPKEADHSLQKMAQCAATGNFLPWQEFYRERQRKCVWKKQCPLE